MNASATRPARALQAPRNPLSQLTMRLRARSNTALFRIGSHGNQAHLSTFQDPSRSHARLSRPQQNAGRSKSDREPPREGPAPPRAVAADGKRLGLDAGRRLRSKADFERLLRHGRRRSLDGFTFYLGRRDAGPPRLGLLVTRKHASKATDRNRIKRCIREAFRLEQERLGAMDVLVRPPLRAVPDAAMLTALRALFRRLGE